MHRSYQDIVARIAQAPLWWLEGVPRYEPFRPDGLLAGTEALLLHVRCQSCGRDFHVGLGAQRPAGESYAGLLNSRRQPGIAGDPPRHDCTGDTMIAEEVAVLEFWRRSLTPARGHGEWQRVPDHERGLEESGAAREERHREAWSRIRRFRARPDGLMGAWTPVPRPPDFPPRQPNPPVEPSPTTGKAVDTPALNARRRLALLALSGRIDAQEHAALARRPQTEFAPFEERPAGPGPGWAEPLAREIAAIDETILANAIPGYREMDAEQREERYCPGLGRILFALAVTGRIAPEERQEVLRALMAERYS